MNDSSMCLVICFGSLCSWTHAINSEFQVLIELSRLPKRKLHNLVKVMRFILYFTPTHANSC
ncbi:hypothetical protein Pint_29166 [Pistacia integerrima]|uniref:Uncharacterized protein n=1 Tax=Pistacia integerrima TaxID=434235 RepID=A0ACC0WYM7_9ROSI|nr:hypothetical protein Pint_29166 [Pistacia integerrima]